MKNLQTIVLLFLLFLNFIPAHAQNAEKFEIYKPEANAADEFARALVKAKAENKHVLMQIGGNWCKWCRAFYKFTSADHEADSILKADYIVLHVNFSKENKNLAFLKSLDFPQRFGFPVFVITNANGQRLHTQNSWYLENGKDGYDKKKVMEFFKNWSPAALNPENYPLK